MTISSIQDLRRVLNNHERSEDILEFVQNQIQKERQKGMDVAHKKNLENRSLRNKLRELQESNASPTQT